MAIYTNLDAVDVTLHRIVETSDLKATTVGKLYDALVVDSTGKAIAVDNGASIKIGDYTGNGLQEVKATVAAKGDKVALVATPAVNKAAMTKAEEAEDRFFNEAGKLSRAYEVVADDRFGVSTVGMTGTPVEKKYLVVDGNGGWKVENTAPDKATYGFIAQIINVATALTTTLVRVKVIQNVQL